MLRAVLDANIFISAALQPAGPPGLIVNRFLFDEAFDLVLSLAIVEEVLRALGYPKIRKLLGDEAKAELWFEDFVVLANMVTPERGFPGICQDPDDDKYLAAALEGSADCVVTGDHGFLSLSEHEGILIITPRTFLGLLDAQSST